MSATNIRLRTTGTHMAIAMGILVIPLVLFITMCQPGGGSAPTIDANRVYDAAAHEGAFTVERPKGLPDGYKATQSAFRPHNGGAITVRVTYITPSDKALQFVQTNRDATTAIEEGLGNTRLDATETVAERTWQRYPLERAGETGYVLLDGERTAYVAGDATQEEMRTFISSLN
ncbi:MAG: DUF4245 domain-containing protein [Corynebacteriales bacterium]|nr:DUF4245 domain-containing protein [Mycobacteriales bacterium]